MGFLSSLGKVVSKGLDYISAPLSQPITLITQGPSAAAKKVEETRKAISAGKASGGKVIATTLATTAVVATGVLAAGGAAGAGTAGAVARAVATSKPAVTLGLGTAALAVAAPKTLQAISSQPEAAKVAVAAGINPVLGIVAGIEQGSSLLKTAVKENEGSLKTAGGIAAAALLTGGAIVAGTKVAELFKGDGKEGILGTDDTIPADMEKTIQSNPALPQLAETQTITTGTTSSKKRKRRATKPQIQNISQRVNVVVSQRQSKKYLKACAC